MIHGIVRVLEIIAVLGCGSSIFYYLLCLWSAVAFLRERKAAAAPPPVAFTPPVSILKPLKGTDPEIYESFRSHCLQDYPEYEIVFGVSDATDAAVASVERLQREFPERSVRLVVCHEILGANVKVSNLEQMVSVARYEHLIVNDSDIRVERDYLRRVLAPMADPQVGMVTCMYRGIASNTLGSRLEALGISTDFCAGVLAARQLEGGIRFGLGSTLAFRRGDLEKIGGFRALVDYLADDYELGKRIAELGRTVKLSDVVVETHLPEYGLRGFVLHQMRWARGVRDSRAGGYFGLISTFGLMWAVLLAIFAYAVPWAWALVAATLLMRFVVAFVVGGTVLNDGQVLRLCWLIPLRDVIAVGVWIASFAGHTVTWRGDLFLLNKGKLSRIS